MADRAKKWAQNVPGPYYVDEDCIDCNLCSEIAPETFAVNKDEGHDYVHTQPADDAARKLAEEALESCPVESIGRDGEG